MPMARREAAVLLGVLAGATPLACGQCDDTLLYGRSLRTNDEAYCCLAWDPDGSGPEPECLVVGGRFTAAGWYEHRVSTSACAAWDGRAWHAMAAPPGAVIYALATRGSELFACGRGLGSSGAATVARWDGTAWRPLPSAVDAANGEAVLALGVHNADLIAVGTFGRIEDVQAPGVAAWDGATWRSMGSPPMLAHAVTSHAELLIVAGDRLLGPASSLAAWNGHKWIDMPGAPVSGVSCMLSLGADLVVGGSFLSAGEHSARNVATWDGIEWHPLGAGLDLPMGGGGVWTITEWQGRLYAGGNIRTSGPTATSANLAVWDGELWAAPTLSRVALILPRAMATVDGRLWIAGTMEGRAGVAMLGAPYEVRIESLEQAAAVCVGERAQLRMRVSGTPPMAYQWRRDGVPIPGGAGPLDGPPDGDYSVLTTPPVTEAATYDCVVTGACGETTSAPVVVHPGPPDFNGDGVGDLADVATLVDCLAGGELCPATADVNRDGNADQDDVAAFVRWVTAGACP